MICLYFKLLSAKKFNRRVLMYIVHVAIILLLTMGKR